MAKIKNKRSVTRNPVRNFDDEDMDLDIGQEPPAEKTEKRPARRSASSSMQDSEFDPKQWLESFNNFIEGNPARATALGAIFGGLVAGLLATEKGRSLLKASYSYARPMISDYARRFAGGQADNTIDRSLPQ